MLLFLLAGGAQAAPAQDTYPAARGPITITPLFHASVQVEHGDRVIQVDPWSMADLSHAKPADLILVTDDVGHHLDPKAIARLRKPGAPVIAPASGRARVADVMVLGNGESATVAGVRVEATAAYDIIPGAPEHPKGEANGYLVTVGGARLFFAGVTECVPEVRGLRDIDVAFLPMNIPVGRMVPAAAAECARQIAPKVVYVYHYDQELVARLANPAPPQLLPGGLTIQQSLDAFRAALAGSGIEVRERPWYPAVAKQQ